MADRMLSASVARRRAGVIALVALLSVSIGVTSVERPEIVFLALGALVTGWFVIRRDAGLLFPLSVLALVIGSSTIPGGDVWFVAKFAVIAATAATVIPWTTDATREHLPVPKVPLFAFGAFLALALASWSWSIAPSITAQHVTTLCLVGIVAYVAVPTWARSADDIRVLIVRAGLVAAGVACIGLIAGMAGYVDFPAYGRFFGIFGNANALGFLVAPILPALVLLAATADAGAKRRWLMATIVLLSLSLVLSGSRGGSLASLVGVAVGLFAASMTGRVQHARRVLAVLVVSIAAIVFIYALFGLPLRNRSVSREGYLELGTGSDRTIAWADTLPVIRQRPWSGSGFATTQVLFPTDVDPSLSLFGGHVHNSYLEAGIDLGWPGTTALALLVFGGAVAAFRVSRRPGPAQVVGLALLAAIAGGATEGVFESGLLAAGAMLCLPFWTAVAAAHALSKAGAPEPSPGGEVGR